MAEIIDGKGAAERLRRQLQGEITSLSYSPGLAVVLVGADPASQVYVRNKIKACKEVGIQSFHHELPETTTEKDLLQLIDELNQNKNVDSILVQLPLPKQINEQKVLQHINPKKDVDGFHPTNMGRLLLGLSGPTPCTPTGVMHLIGAINYSLEGKKATVLGRSNIVGKPMGLMLLQENATVTITHSRTKNLKEIIQESDVVVSAIGKPEFIKGDWIKKGALIIDVGINRTPEGKLVGDVAFEEAIQAAGWITPVPGGVGPMTIAMLLKNTLAASKLRNL